jgi:hypothetical protein
VRALAMLLVWTAVAAAGEPVSDFARAKKQRQRALAEFWRAYQGRMNEADEVSYRPVHDALTRMSKDREAVLDLGPYRRLYEDCVAIEDAFGKAAGALARSEDPEAAPALLRELFETADDIARAEEELLELGASAYVDRFDQRTRRS